jgi:type I restriction enzyme S subunit
MELRLGYKHSEVGVIPDDWEARELDDFISFISYGFTNPMPTSRSGPLMVTAADVIDGRIAVDTARRTTQDAFDRRLTAKSRPKKNDILLTKDGALGRIALVGDEQICINQSVAILRANNRVYPKFLSILLQAEPYQKRMIEDAGGSTIKHIYITIVNRMPIAVPPLRKEQCAIAAALSDVDAALVGLEQLSAKKRDLKQAAMQQLLTGKKRLPGFSGAWEVKRLGELLRIRHGKSQRDVEVVDGPYPILATGGQIGTASRPLYDKPSVLIGRKGTIDEPRFMETPFWSVDTLFFSEMIDQSDAKFLFYRFTMIEWRRYNEASGVPSLNAKTIENIEILAPKSDEQTAIAAVLSDMDAELATLTAQTEKTRLLKQAMMQELLTGRIRLPIAENADG